MAEWRPWSVTLDRGILNHAAFGMLRTLVDAWYAGAEATSATRLVTRNAISLPYFLNQASFSCSFTTSPTITRLGGRTV
jgi:hypothetical protein